jgi:hypothetical protein
MGPDPTSSKRPDLPLSRRVLGTLSGVPPLLAGVFLVFVLCAGLSSTTFLNPQTKLFLLATTAVLLGTVVGATEILRRYRDEPFQALVTLPAVNYVLLNGLISLASFALLRRYPRFIPGLDHDLVMTALAAGFGGMMVARSKLFTYPGERGSEYSFGPAIALETLLKTLDRNVDRIRSAQRQARVFQRVQDLPDDASSFLFALDFVEASLLSYQNLSQAEKAGIAKDIDDYRHLAEWPVILRMLAVGFVLLNLTGETNFDQVMDQLKLALKERQKRQHS